MYGIGKKHHREVMDELRTVFTFYTVGPFSLPFRHSEHSALSMAIDKKEIHLMHDG